MPSNSSACSPALFDDCLLMCSRRLPSTSPHLPDGPLIRRYANGTPNSLIVEDWPCVELSGGDKVPFVPSLKSGVEERGRMRGVHCGRPL